MSGRLASLRARLDAFSVFDWADTPLWAIFWRELVVALRYRRYAMLLIGLSAALLVAIVFNLGHLLAGTIPSAEAITNVVGLQCSALLLLLFFVIPALSAVTVSAERHQNTEDLLNMALNEPLSNLAGKLLAMLALFSVFHLALLPFAVFTYFFAGIEVRSFFQITFMLYGTALCHSVIGVAISRTNTHMGRALFWTYFALFAMYVLPSWWTGQLLLARPGAGGVNFSLYLNPVPLLRDLLHSLAGWRQCLQFLGLQLGAAGLVILASEIVWRATPHLAGKGARLPPTGSARHERRIPPAPDWRNVIYHKDYHTAPLARLGWTVATFLLGVAGSAGITYWAIGHLDLALSGAQIGTVFLIILAPLVVLERCGKEMDPTSLLMLRMSRLGSEHVLLGKSYIACRCLLPLTLGIAAGNVLPLLFAPENAQSQIAAAQNVLPYQSALLPLKLALFVLMCLAVVRYRSPNATDLAITLVLATLGTGAVELVRAGLFDSVDWKKLSYIHLVFLYAAQVIVGGFGGLILFLTALMRFEAVFDEGSDAFAVRHVDRGNF